MDVKDLTISQSQYYGFWWFNDSWDQYISSRGIDLRMPEYSTFRTIKVKENILSNKLQFHLIES